MDNVIKYIVEKYKDGEINKDFTQETLSMLVKESKNIKKNDDIAIIGMALKIADFDNLDDYWKVISEGVDCIRKFPQKRAEEVTPFVVSRYGEKKEFCKGAYMDDVSGFDYKFFHCTPKEASLMDPNQKIFLEVAWKALEDSGYLNDEIEGNDVGIFMGYSPSISESYQEMINTANKSDVQISIPFNVSSIVASRLAYFLDLKGPSMVIDSACSSGLVAVDSAIKYLNDGECSMALAGGIKLHLLPVDDLDYRMGIESEDSHTRAFDGESTGAGFGEGAAALVLKKLSDAQKDHDHIYAVIKGCEVNQDGQSMGITAPNPESQKMVVQKVWSDAEIDPETIDYIEAHGTGTVLGDPIELNSLNNIFSKYTKKKNFCAVSSVKSNIGHLYECAGIASIIKAVLALNHKVIPKTINYNKVNQKIEFLNSPLYINTKNREWKTDGHLRRCGVSGFGYSGTNAHLILEEYVNERNDNSKQQTCLMTFSANSETSLLSQIKMFASNEEKLSEYSLKDIAWNLSYCRKHYNYRLTMIAESIEDFIYKLKYVATNGLDSKHDWLYYSHFKIVSDNKEHRMDYEITMAEKKELSMKTEAYIENHSYSDVIDNISAYYVKGADINWAEIYGNQSSNYRISLPSYVFDKQESWVNLDFQLRETVQKADILQNTVNDTERKIQVSIVGKSDITETEKGVCDILTSILGFNEIDVYDNFFELGLDSITMLRVVGAIKEKFQVSLAVNAFMEGMNVERLAGLIDSSDKEESDNSVKADLEHRYDEFDLTNIQRAYVMGRNSYYNLGNTSTHIYLEYETDLEIGRLEKAINCIIKKHPMLRCVIYKNLKQRILKEVPNYHIDTLNLEDASYMECKMVQMDFRTKMSHQIFDIEKWPLFDVKAIEMKSKKYLFVSLDLLIADGISLQILLHDLYMFYKNLDTEIHDVEYTLRDYITQYKERKSLKQSACAKEYWEKRLNNDVFQAPELPLLKKIDEVDTPHFSRKRMDFGKKSLGRLNEVARKHRVTVSAILCTAYAETLRTWSVKKNFIINIASYNRYDFNKYVSEMVGDFTSVLLLAVDYMSEFSFWEKVEYIQKNIMEGIENRDYDGVDIISDILAKTGKNEQAIFPVVFTSLITDEDFDNSFFGKEIFGANQTPQVYLDYQARAEGGEFIIVWDYVDELLANEVVSQMFEFNSDIIRQVLADVDYKKPGNYITEGLKKYNSTYKKFKLQPFIQLFKEQVKKYVKKEAIVLEDDSITYEELDIRSNQIGNFLISQNVKSGDYVGIITERKIQSVVDIIGVLKSGAAYVPIDIQYPEERKNYIINNNQCKYVLTCNSYFELGLEKYDSSALNVDYQLRDVMYTIYTSGSTGRPKGVVETQESVMNTIFDINEKFHINDKDRYIGISSFCFDLSVFDVLGSLLAGATLVLVKDQRDINNLIQVAKNQKITIWNSVPAIMNLAVQNMMEENESLRLVMLSGDWIPLNLPGKVRSLLPNAQVVSLGGATEGAIWSIYYPIEKLEETWSNIPYGMPLANQQMYILDENLEQCPPMVQGEICIGGAGVAQGYCGEEEKTRKAFILHDKFGYIYRTGDYGAYAEDGYIAFMGRKDMQVKINGYRVELGEIEKRICSVDGVKDAAVILRKGRQNILVAFITINKGITENDVKEEIAQYLPPYMIPGCVKIVSEFALTANGKIDYKALQNIKIGEEGISNEDKKIVPETKVQAKVLDIIKELSNNAEVYLENRIFEVGVDSILIISIITRLNREFQVKLTLADVFKSKSIKEICDLIEISEKNSEPEIPVCEKKDFYETSRMQQELYLACINNVERNNSYKIKHAIIVEGNLNINKTKEVINQLVKRHEALRTHVKEINGKLVQIISDYKELEVKVSSTKATDLDEIIAEHNISENFTGEDLFQFEIIQLSDRRNMLLFSLHHIISDGMSLHVLMDDFIQYYNGTESGILSVQYKEYVEWFNHPMNSDEKNFWRQVLHGQLPLMDFPKDFFVDRQETFEGDVVSATISDDYYKRLKNMSSETEYTIFMILYTSLNVLVRQYYGSDDIIMGVTSSGRSLDCIKNVVGMFVNTLPIRVLIDGTNTFDRILQQVKTKIIESTNYQKFVIEEMFDDLQMSSAMLYDIIFSYQSFETTDFHVDGLTFKQYEVPEHSCKVPLEFAIIEMDNQIKITIKYSKELFLKSTIEEIMNQYLQILEHVIGNVNIPVGDLAIQESQSAEESDDFIIDFNF
ncbi:non-ribosomal peptide synthetase [Clostridium felsineum]|uniref:non-ribosomal peptide synthetase n=1 Tax=Clostridium felsineum TaxID=36839 RepID=UPI00098C9A88|nr:non-ribosomal peptide synthetase [Clostridium felsineum]URZ01263.1 D-alanine--D-alanyl carrier protein ligase [Clostridium felsineum]